MATVRRRYVVVVLKVDADAGSDGFLTGGEMQWATDIRLREARAEGGDAAARSFLGGVLERADARHGAEKRDRALGRRHAAMLAAYFAAVGASAMPGRGPAASGCAALAFCVSMTAGCWTFCGTSISMMVTFER